MTSTFEHAGKDRKRDAAAVRPRLPADPVPQFGKPAHGLREGRYSIIFEAVIQPQRHVSIDLGAGVTAGLLCRARLKPKRLNRESPP
jgi:hypothetical protein